MELKPLIDVLQCLVLLMVVVIASLWSIENKLSKIINLLADENTVIKIEENDSEENNEKRS